MPDIRSQLLEEIERLREVAAKAGDARLSAILIAASDERAQELLVSRAGSCHYVGALVSTSGGLTQVVFEFRRPQGVFGILPLAVLVRVDLTERRVVSVVDNYLPRGKTLYRDLGVLQPDLDLRTRMAERFDDEFLGEEGGPKVAPPPKGNLWV